MARSQELEQIVQNQEAKLRLLAMAGSIPESEIDNIILAQELTEEQIYEAQGEVIPSHRIWVRFIKNNNNWSKATPEVREVS